MGGTSGNIGTFYLYNDGHQQWQEQVEVLVGDHYYKDKSDNVTTCSCHCWCPSL
jgi:photosystem II stability/assembly factor-like uncharacterized protein